MPKLLSNRIVSDLYIFKFQTHLLAKHVVQIKYMTRFVLVYLLTTHIMNQKLLLHNTHNVSAVHSCEVCTFIFLSSLFCVLVDTLSHPRLISFSFQFPFYSDKFMLVLSVFRIEKFFSKDRISIKHVLCIMVALLCVHIHGLSEK